MIRETITILLSAALICACSSNGTQDVRYDIKGNISDLVNGNVYLVDDNGNPMDSAKVSEGKFRLQGSVPQETGAYLIQYPSFMTLMLLEDGTATIDGDIENITLGGTPANIGYQKMIDSLKGLNEEEDYELKAAELELRTFEENHDNILGVFLLQNELFSWDAEQLSRSYEMLPEKFQQREDMMLVRDKFERMMATTVGQKFIDIKMNDPMQKSWSLSDIVASNEYVLLDFWASWCDPCMKEVPNLVEAYRAYHDNGFEIFGVSLDQEPQPWVKAFVDNSMDWLQVSDLNYWDSSAVKEYAVISIPANYLISKEGVIVARNLRGSELMEKLGELMGEPARTYTRPDYGQGSPAE